MKKNIITFTLILLVVFVGTIVLATETPALQVTPKVVTSTDQVSGGGDLGLTFSVESMTGEISTVAFKVEYDTEVFEALNDNSFEGLNNWKSVYDQLSGQVTLTRVEQQGNQTMPGDLAKINFTAKSNVAGKTVTITIKDMDFRGGADVSVKPENISTQNITVGTIQVLQPGNEQPTPIVEEPKDTDPKVEEPKDTQPEEIPETGLNDTMTYIIMALVIAAAIFYTNYKRLERKNVRYVNID